MEEGDVHAPEIPDGLVARFCATTDQYDTDIALRFLRDAASREEGNEENVLNRACDMFYVNTMTIPSPEAVLRASQDEEYERTLSIDREKERAAEQAYRDNKEREERVRIVREEKAQRTRPQEPSAEDGESVLLIVREPHGGKWMRRFCENDTVQNVFDCYDTERQAQSGTFPCSPGSYKLVQTYPKKEYADGDVFSGTSLRANGIGARQNVALFLVTT